MTEDRMPRATVEAIPYRGSPWQPIATAPKDGTVFLSWDGEYMMPVAWSTRDKAWFVADDDCDDWEGLTHWMPLPEPPNGPA